MQAALVLSFLFAGCSAMLFTEPPVQALDGVEQALKKITALPHLSAPQQKSAKSVVDFVMQTVHDVEATKGLTKEAKAKKVKEAINKLQALQQQWTNVTMKMTTADRKVGELQAQLAEKRQELAKAEGMLKLNKLKKELLEKKLLLNKLVAEQAEAKQQKSQQKAEAAAKDAMVKQLSTAANEMATNATQKVGTSSKGNTKATQIAAIVAMLHARQHNITEAIKKLDAAEKTSESTFDKLAGKSLDANKDEGVAKAQRMLRNVKKQEHRKIEKAKATKKAELAEVTDAVKSIEKGDVKGLQTVLTKMQGEMQALDSHARNFIY